MVFTEVERWITNACQSSTERVPHTDSLDLSPFSGISTFYLGEHSLEYDRMERENGTYTTSGYRPATDN